MNETQRLRSFWSVPTFEQARDERVTVPANPGAYTDTHQGESLRRVLGPFSPAGHVLDYGCGVGRTSRALIRAGAQHVVACDVSDSMLLYCADYCLGSPGLLTLMRTDGYGCPDLADASCDGVICLYVLQHLPSLDMVNSVLADLQRVLRPGGWMVLQITEHEQQPDGRFFGVPLTVPRIVQQLPDMRMVSIDVHEQRQFVIRLRKGDACSSRS